MAVVVARPGSGQERCLAVGVSPAALRGTDRVRLCCCEMTLWGCFYQTLDLSIFACRQAVPEEQVCVQLFCKASSVKRGAQEVCWGLPAPCGPLCLFSCCVFNAQHLPFPPCSHLCASEGAFSVCHNHLLFRRSSYCE